MARFEKLREKIKERREKIKEKKKREKRDRELVERLERKALRLEKRTFREEREALILERGEKKGIERARESVFGPKKKKPLLDRLFVGGKQGGTGQKRAPFTVADFLLDNNKKSKKRKRLGGGII